MTEPKRAYRICPCSSYDVEGIQSWLQDMAREGLSLERDGFFAGLFTFLRTSPKQVTYRLEAIQKKRHFFDDENAPEREILDISAELGWEFVLRYGMFYIYRSYDLHPRELHTDPAVQAMAMETVRNRQRNTLLWSLILVCMWFFLRTASYRYVFRNAVIIGPLYVAAYLLFIAWMMLDPIRALARLHSYWKRLQSGEAISRKVDWKKHAPLHKLYHILPALLMAFLIVCPFSVLVRAVDETSLDEYSENPPFVTIQDLIAGGTYDNPGTTMGDYNTMRQWSTAVAPMNMEWSEWAEIRAEDGRSYSGILRIDYHQTLAPWIAEGVFNDYYDYDAHRYRSDRFEDLDAPDVEVDNIRVYSSYGILHVLMQQDGQVLHATVSLEDQAGNSVWEDWATLAAAQLSKE